MRKIMKNTIVLVVLFTTLLANAKVNASLNNLSDAKKTVLTLNDVKQGNELLIKNIDGNILYKELIKNSGDYIKGFNLTALPKGDYTFELNDDSKIKIIPFNVSKNIVTYKNEEETTIFKTTVRNDENKVYICKLSLNQQPLDVEVYYEGNTEDSKASLIYTETIDGSLNIGRVLSLDKSLKGKYRIVTKSEGRTFVDNIQY